MRTFVLAVLLCVTTLCDAAGIRFFQIPADERGPTFKAVVWTPCAEATQDVPVGPYVLRAKRDCPVAGQHLPLVVISHGHGGNALSHHDLAETLADAGFVVVALSHPGDTYSDMSRSLDMSVFVERPLDIKRLIDFMLSQAPEATAIDPERIGFYGFSRGGYTGLVLAGGNPDFIHAKFNCPDTLPICQQIHRKEVPQAPWTHDPRIKAFVIADPFSAFPTAASVEGIHAPIQLWGSEFGGDGVTPESVKALISVLPTKPEFHLVTGSAHFAFLAPCPAEMATHEPEICVDDKGFDRVAFHQNLDQKVLEFFQAHLR